VFWKTLGRAAKQMRFWVAFFLVIFIVTMMGSYWQGHLTPKEVLATFHAHPNLAPALFFFVYAMMVVALLPTLPLNLAAGALWGPALGSMLSIAAAATGASAAFLASRYLISGFLRSRFEGRAWSWLESEIVSADWKAVAFVRMNPVFPFGPLNYFFGVTGIPFSRYLWATLIFIAPPSFIIAAIGDAVGGFVLRGSAADWMRNVFLISFAVTAFVGMRYGLRYWAGRNHRETHDPIKDTDSL
jgi:uncharacterized membrane protein YdjX (TVP38/TMEM64 family)